MSKISPLQAAALGLISEPAPASAAARPTVALGATKTKIVKPKVAKAVSSKPASMKQAAAKTVSTAKPAVKTVVKTTPKTAPKTATKTTPKASKTALKPAPKTTRSTNLKQNLKKNGPHRGNQKNTNKKDDKKDDKKIRPEKVKMERDSFTMPKDEYAQLTLLKARLMAMGQPAKKSELLRAGIKLLAAMSDNTLKTTLAKIPVIKTGRPNK